MNIFIEALDAGLIKAGHDIGRIIFPAAEFTATEDKADIIIKIKTVENDDTVQAEVALISGPQTYTRQMQEAAMSGTEKYNQLKRVAKLAYLKVLEEYTSKQAGPWGILTGIRPTKIVHRLMDANWPEEDIKKHLVEGYALAKEKASLLWEIAGSERQYLLDNRQASDLVSVFIGIPFCPTRCAYCSFPSYSMGQAGHLMEPFLQALKKEMVAFGQYLKKKGLQVQTIYVGGGTPTSLHEGRLAGLLRDINENLISVDTIEFTVEAGRPDTINREKAQVMKEAGVTRISINPQTMNADTLMTIGRAHQPWDVVDAVDIAREGGLNNINMDLIIGLPGENLDQIRETMRYVGMLAPESITLHTLAVKRASEINENRQDYELPDSDTVIGMFDMAMHMARMSGMQPYYLYRQKQMVGPLENIGFALQGFECVYNIQMIEERQTIIGLGAGAGSKFVSPEDWTLESFYNPKDPGNYIERIDELTAKKVARLDKVFAR